MPSGDPGMSATTRSEGVGAGGRRAFLMASVGVLLLVARVGHAQARTGAVVSMDAARPMNPGGRATVVVPLVNVADTAVAYRILVDVPAGWRVGDLQGSAIVPPRGRILRFVTVSTNRSVPAGEVRVAYSVLAGARIVQRDSVRFLVAERHALSLTAAAPRYAAFGSSYVSRFVVRNAGNSQRTFRVSIVSDLSAAINSAGERTLAADGEDTISVTVAVPARGVSRRSSSVTMRLQPTVVDTAEHLTAFAETSVYPIGGDAPWITLPLALTSRVSNQGPTMLVEGGGTLGSSGSRMDVLLRGPRRDATIDATADEYRLSVQTPGWGVRLGDQPVLLSPLTEYGRVATGGSLRLGDSLMSLSAGGVRTRVVGEAAHLQETFAQIGLRLARSLQLAVSGLARTGRPNDSGTVGTVQIAFRTPARQAEVELARSLAGGGAVRGRISQAGRHLELNASGMVADTTYPGYSRGSRIADGSLRWSLSRTQWIRVAGEDRHTTSGLLFDGGANPDTLVLHEPLRQHRYQSASGTLALGDFLQVDGRWKRREDPLGPTPWGSERTVEASLTVGGLGLQISPRVELGQSFNPRTTDGTPLQRVSVDTRVGLGAWGRLRASFGFQAGQSMYDTVQARSWRSGTWLDAKVDHTQVTVGAQFGLMSLSNAWAAPEFSRRVDLSVVQALAADRELLARLRWDPRASTRVGSTTQVELGVRLPLQLPVARPQTSSWIRGRIREEATGVGAPGVMLRLGEQLAMTDDKGQFQFARVVEGTHVLDVDMNTVAVGRLLRDSVMRTVTAVNGRGTDVELTLVQGGRLTGRVLWFDAAPRSSLDSAALARAPVAVLRGGAPDIELLLESGTRKLRTVTNSSGDFAVEALEPGPWRVSVSQLDVPPTHVSADTALIEVRPGESTSVTLRIMPRRRTVHVVEAHVTTPGAVSDSSRRSAPARQVAPVRAPRPVPVHPQKPCPWPVVRPNGPICAEPVRDSVPLPPRLFPPR